MIPLRSQMKHLPTEVGLNLLVSTMMTIKHSYLAATVSFYDCADKRRVVEGYFLTLIRFP